MRSSLIALAVSAVITNLSWAEDSPIAKEISAPDRSYNLVISDEIRVMDPGGSSLITLASNLEGVKQVDAKWSTDSHLVVVVISYARGSGVEAAYVDGTGWHKTLQSDTDLPTDELSRQAGTSGRLVAQQCRLGSWLDARRITVTGELTFSRQEKVPYEYTLVFTGEATHLDRGGFEEGAIKGIGYRVR